MRRTAILPVAAVLALAVPGVAPAQERHMARCKPDARGAAAVLAAGVALAGGGCRSGERAERAVKPPAFFSPTSHWNAPIERDAAVDRRSRALVRDLLRQVRDYPVGIATVKSSVPIYRVSARQRTVRVRLTKDTSPLLSEAFASVPLPPDARPADGVDQNLAVHQPATDTMWEFWHLRHGAGGWTADWGGKMTGVSRSPGRYRDLRRPDGTFYERAHWGAPATKLALVGGLVTMAELRAGRVDHALNLALPEPRAGVWAWPAQATDGVHHRADAIPEGARLRIDPGVDLGKLGLSRTTLVLARAAQRYGMLVANRSTGVVLRAEDPMPTGANPYVGADDRPGDAGDLFSDWPSELMAEFPWRHVQVMELDLRSEP